jgi:hypothetical protein
MAAQQTIEDQQKHCEHVLKECAALRTPPLTIAALVWTTPSHRDEYDLAIQLTGQESPSPHHFVLPGFDLAQNGPYLRDITKGWLSHLEHPLGLG